MDQDLDHPFGESEGESSDDYDGMLWGAGDYKVPVIKYSPEEIFSNKIPALDVNFLNPSVKNENGDIDPDRNSAFVLRGVISSWYVAIRTLALVGLLSVLVYLGIRMILTSIAADKAKYKQMLMNWVVAICLLFFLHYIMSFALTISESMTNMISTPDGGSVNVKLGGSKPISFSTNLIGLMRFRLQYKDTWSKLLYMILYIAMVAYTVIFTWKYLKRVLNMAFLTLMAPLVALTYPIDKVSDGKAQAFDMWLKEFCFNAILQPFHLLIYTILVTSAITLAASNPLYAIVALGFIIPAEKLLKKMFGFDKASATVGSLASAAGGAMAQKAFSSISKGGSSRGSSSGGKDKIRTKDSSDRTLDINGNRKLQGFDEEAENMAINQAHINSPEETQQLEAGVPPQPVADNNNGTQELEDLDNNQRYLDTQNEDQEENSTTENINTVDTGSANNDEIENRTLKVPKEVAEKKKKRNDKLKSIKKVAGRALYSGSKVGLKTAARVGMGITAAGIGAGAALISGDPGKIGAATLAGLSAGYAGGGKLINSTVGRAGGALERKLGIDGSVKSTYNTARYGSNIQAANVKADKEYEQSGKLQDYINQTYSDKTSSEKKEIAKSFMEYRKVGITDENTIRKSLKLEENGEFTRKQAQNIAQMSSKNKVTDRAWTDSKVYEAERKNMESMLGKASSGKEFSNEAKYAASSKVMEGMKKFRNS